MLAVKRNIVKRFLFHVMLVMLNPSRIYQVSYTGTACGHAGSYGSYCIVVPVSVIDLLDLTLPFYRYSLKERSEDGEKFVEMPSQCAQSLIVANVLHIIWISVLRNATEATKEK